MAYNNDTHEIIFSNSLHYLYDIVNKDTRGNNYKDLVWVIMGENKKAVFSMGKYPVTEYKKSHCVKGDCFPRFFAKAKPTFETAEKLFDNLSGLYKTF